MEEIAMDRVDGIACDLTESVHFVIWFSSLFLDISSFSGSVAVLLQNAAFRAKGTLDALRRMILNLSLLDIIREESMNFDDVIECIDHRICIEISHIPSIHFVATFLKFP